MWFTWFTEKTVFSTILLISRIHVNYVYTNNKITNLNNETSIVNRLLFYGPCILFILFNRLNQYFDFLRSIKWEIPSSPIFFCPEHYYVCSRLYWPFFSEVDFSHLRNFTSRVTLVVSCKPEYDNYTPDSSVANNNNISSTRRLCAVNEIDEIRAPTIIDT